MVSLVPLVLPTPTSNQGENTAKRTGHDSLLYTSQPHLPVSGLSGPTPHSTLLPPAFRPPSASPEDPCSWAALPGTPPSSPWPGCYSCFHVTSLGRPPLLILSKAAHPIVLQSMLFPSKHPPAGDYCSFWFPLVAAAPLGNPMKAGTSLSCSYWTPSAQHGQTDAQHHVLAKWLNSCSDMTQYPPSSW